MKSREAVAGHLRRFAGPQLDWWDATTSGRQLACAIVKSRGEASLEGTVLYASLGLSDHELSQPLGRRIRQELVMCCDARFEYLDVLPQIVERAAQEALGSNSALLHGEHVGDIRGLLPSGSMTTLYVTHPWFWPAHAHHVQSEDPPIVFAALVPITAAEHDVLTRSGWEELERDFATRQPDLYDLARP